MLLDTHIMLCCTECGACVHVCGCVCSCVHVCVGVLAHAV